MKKQVVPWRWKLTDEDVKGLADASHKDLRAMSLTLVCYLRGNRCQPGYAKQID